MAQLAWTQPGAGGLGLGQLLASGPSQRVRAFLHGLLTASTQLRYSNASALFWEYCEMNEIRFKELTEEKQRLEAIIN